MVKFNSLSGIRRFVNSAKGQTELLKMNDQQIRKILTDATKELKKYLIQGLQDYYASYKPNAYKRTYQTLSDINLGNPVQVSPGVYNVSIEMNSDHKSLFDDEDGNTLWLLNAGWKTNWDSVANGGKGIDHFSRFEGTNYIQNAINKFNSNNKYGMNVKVYFNDDDVTGFKFSYGR